jgi:hypothetical protein
VLPPAARLTRLGTLAVAAALVARLAFAFGYWVGKPMTNDELEYLQLARSLARGEGFAYTSASSEQPASAGFGRAPLYPLFVSLMARVTSPATLVPAIKIAQSLLGAGAVWLIALVAQRAAGSRAADLAAWLAALYPPLVWLPAFMLSEPLYMVLALANVLVVEGALHPRDCGAGLQPRSVEAGLQPHVIFAGILAALAALTRPSHLFFLALVAIWLLSRRRWTACAAFVLAAALTIAPWTIRNYVAYGRPVLIASEGGITFWTGNHPLSPGEGDMAANPAIKRDSHRLRASHPGLTEEQLEPIYYREALQTIAARPLWWLGLVARKFFYLWIPIGPSYALHSRLFVYTTWIAYGLLLPFGVLGLWQLARSASRPTALLLLLLSAVVACLLFLPQERFRIPVIDPALIVGAAALGGAPRRANSVS